MAGNDQNLAVLLYQDLPAEQIPADIPLDWPAEIKELGSGTTLPAPEWLLMTTSELAQYKAARQPAYDQWEDENIIHEPASDVLKKQVNNDVFASLTNSATLKINHDANIGTCSGDVIPGGVDHDLLLNSKPTQHIDHASVSIVAGNGLSGGGDLTETRTIELADTSVQSASYGSPSQVPVLVVDKQGRITNASNVNILKQTLSYTPLVTNRALNTTFMPSDTASTFVCYTVEIICTASLAGGQTGTVELRSDANALPITARSQVANTNSVSLAIAVTVVNTQRMQLMYLVPPGHNVRLVSSGTATIAIVAQSEVAIGLL